MTHSGGAFGMLLGGLTDLFIRGDADLWPTRGLGYGAGFGVLATGLLATQVRVAPSRVLMIDLAASLGALGGAAAASPLVFGDDRTPTEDRLWLATVTAGTLGGAAIGAYMTRPVTQGGGSASSVEGPNHTPLPFAGVIGESVTRKGQRSPVLGGGIQGVW
jgi:peptidoglycan/LPS O-acetylase OafA/YrhL